MIGKCRLCGETKTLVKAHIIPRSFFDVTQSSDGPARVFSNNSEELYPKRLPQGAYDPSILCQLCDNELGKLDQHAANTMLPMSERKPLVHEGSIVGYEYPRADPVKATMFAASVLWRAAITSLKMFSGVKLGPYENQIADILRGNASLGPDIGLYIAEFEDNQIALFNPSSTKFNGVRCWLMYANRFVFYVRLHKKKLGDPFAELAIESGRPVISCRRDWLESKERRLAVKIVKASPYRPKPER